MDINTFEKNQTIMMSGDSVTDCGRARPYGTYFYGLGNGYVQKLHEIITTAVPEKEIKLINAGISGETSRHIRGRWEQDVQTVKPDYACLMIGINDIWRKYDTYLDKSMAVHADEYEDNLRFILNHAVKNLKGFMLIAPFYLETNKKDVFMADVSEYSAICKKLAAEYTVNFCDLQPEFNRMMKTLYTTALSPDRVHPNQLAHFVIARKLAKQLNIRL